ncbi:MAG: OST-HTH/LOTUS domain-containing protein, partial [Polymorphobacter sp.]
AAPATAAAPAKTPVDDALINLLVDALAASKRDERGFANLSEVGKLAGNRSSYDVRNYGFARLSDLVETIPRFAVERREGGAVYVKRVR